MRHLRTVIRDKWINVILTAFLLLVSSQGVGWFVQPRTAWIDLIAAGDLDSTSGKVFRRHLPRRGERTGLVATLSKPHGGVHNRVWSLHIEVSNSRTADEIRNVKPLEYLAPSPTELTSFCAIQANDDRLTAIFNVRKPGFWYRETLGGYQFLVHQHWDTDVRERGFRDGYYTWIEGGDWRHSDRDGKLGNLLPKEML